MRGTRWVALSFLGSVVTAGSTMGHPAGTTSPSHHWAGSNIGQAPFTDANLQNIPAEPYYTDHWPSYGSHIDEDYETAINALTIHNHPSLLPDASYLEQQQQQQQQHAFGQRFIPPVFQQPPSSSSFNHPTTSSGSPLIQGSSSAYEDNQNYVQRHDYQWTQPYSDSNSYENPPSSGRNYNGHSLHSHIMTDASSALPDSYDHVTDQMGGQVIQQADHYVEDGHNDEAEEADAGMEEPLDDDDEIPDQTHLQGTSGGKEAVIAARPPSSNRHWTEFYKHLSSVNKSKLIKQYGLVLAKHGIRVKPKEAYDRVSTRCDLTIAQDLFSGDWEREDKALRTCSARRRNVHPWIEEERELLWSELESRYHYKRTNLQDVYNGAKHFLSEEDLTTLHYDRNKEAKTYIYLAEKIREAYGQYCRDREAKRPKRVRTSRRKEKKGEA